MRHSAGHDHVSTEIGLAIQRGDIDLGFRRPEPQPDVIYRVSAHEPIVVVMPRDHPLSACSAVDVRDIDASNCTGLRIRPRFCGTS